MSSATTASSFLVLILFLLHTFAYAQITIQAVYETTYQLFPQLPFVMEFAAPTTSPLPELRLSTATLAGTNFTIVKLATLANKVPLPDGMVAVAANRAAITGVQVDFAITSVPQFNTFNFQYTLPLSLRDQFYNLQGPRLLALQFDSTQQAYFTIPSNHSIVTDSLPQVQFTPMIHNAVNSTSRASIQCYIVAAPNTAGVPVIYNQAFKVERFNRTYTYPRNLNIFIDASSIVPTSFNMLTTLYTSDPTNSPVTARPSNLQQAMFFFETSLVDQIDTTTLSSIQFSYYMDKDALANAKIRENTIRFAAFVNNQWSLLDTPSFFNSNTSVLTQTVSATNFIGKWALLGDKASMAVKSVTSSFALFVVFSLFLLLV